MIYDQDFCGNFSQKFHAIIFYGGFIYMILFHPIFLIFFILLTFPRLVGFYLELIGHRHYLFEQSYKRSKLS